MGKSHGYGKRIMRLDKDARREISTGTERTSGPKVQIAQHQAALQGSSKNVHLAAMLRLTQAGPKKIGSFSDRQKSTFATHLTLAKFACVLHFEQFLSRTSCAVLVVGDGDFSFSLSIASVMGGANLICTSLDKASQIQVCADIDIQSVPMHCRCVCDVFWPDCHHVQVKYGQSAQATLQALMAMGAKLEHQVCKSMTEEK
jgi:hypothetical protein